MLNKNRKFSDTVNIGHKTQNKDKQSQDTTHMKKRWTTCIPPTNRG